MLRDTLQRFDEYIEKSVPKLDKFEIAGIKNFITQEITKALESVVPNSNCLRADDTELEIVFKLAHNESIDKIIQNIKNYLE